MITKLFENRYEVTYMCKDMTREEVIEFYQMSKPSCDKHINIMYETKKNGDYAIYDNPFNGRAIERYIPPLPNRGERR